MVVLVGYDRLHIAFLQDGTSQLTIGVPDELATASANDEASLINRVQVIGTFAKAANSTSIVTSILKKLLVLQTLR